MKLKLEELDVTSFPTAEAPAALAAATAGEDCFSFPWVCVTKTRPE